MTAAANRTGHLEPRIAPRPILGSVKTTYPRLAVAGPAVNEPLFSAAAELDAWARRALGANGFGDADVPPGARSPAAPAAPADARPAPELQRPSASFWAICLAVGAAVGSAFAAARLRWREQRELRRTARALAQLDERALKDVGLGAEEIGSVAAELAGRAALTRVHATRALHQLAL